MAEVNYMWIALLMGSFLIVSTVAIDRVRERMRNRSGGNRQGGEIVAATDGGLLTADGMAQSWRRIHRVTHQPAVWTIGFIVLAVGLTAAAIFFVGDFGLPESVVAVVELVILGLLGALIAGYLVLGTWVTARRRGHPFAHALAETLGVLGLLVVLVITTRLII